MPHGLGHLIGLDVHDVGGYLRDCPARPESYGFSRLRTARALEENMLLTIEPGCYFINVVSEYLLTIKSGYYVNDVLTFYFYLFAIVLFVV